MTLDLVSDIWGEFRRYINNMDRPEAADAMINLLIDHDHDIDDIRAAFKNDPDVRRALQSYLDDTEEDTEEDIEDYDRDED